MQQSEYLSVFFVCKKPNDMDDEANNDDFRNGNSNNNGLILTNGDSEAGSVNETNGTAPVVDGDASDVLEK